ncbi:MAG: TetR/AcrR family transcriptional regulator [Lachnospiraceae bacterium]|nr:TetR/AcrR family transcriptional regulator [Lachnospiraceae bacterium]
MANVTLKKSAINKRQKKEALMNTAFELFTSKGINKTSISDIVEKAGVAKGTFYLYFKDKYDIRNYLISSKAEQLFLTAHKALDTTKIPEIEDQIVFIVDNCLNQLTENPSLLNFISKNLSWGVFKKALVDPESESDMNTMDMDELDSENFSFYKIYQYLINSSDRQFKDPEIMLFMIIELVSSTCYSSILYSEPCNIDELKPHLFKQVRHILEDHEEV